MTASKIGVLNHYKACKISKMTGDFSDVCGYSEYKDVYLVDDFTLSLLSEKHDLKVFDNPKADSVILVHGVTVGGTFAKVPLEVLAEILQTTVVSSGTTPNRKNTMSIAAGAIIQPFRLVLSTAATSDDGTINEAQIKLHKCVLTSLSFNISEGYAKVNFETEAIAPLCTNNFREKMLLESITEVSDKLLDINGNVLQDISSVDLESLGGL